MKRKVEVRTMDNNTHEFVEKLEREAKFTIIEMKDECEEKNKILDDAKDEITRLYDEFRVWVADNVDVVEMSNRYELLKDETQNLLTRTKIKLINFRDRDDVQATYECSKDMVLKTSNKIVNCVSDSVQVVKNNEYVSKAVQEVSETINYVKQDERVKRNVKKIKKGTLRIAENAFNGLKRVLDTEDSKDKSQKG